MVQARTLVLWGVVAVARTVFAESFATFPEHKELVSPDQRYVLRSVDFSHNPSDYKGMFHTLVLEDRQSRTSRRMYDYVHKVAVAWSGDYIIVTDYLSHKAARALVFSVDPRADTFMVDRVDLADRISQELGSHLRYNERVFVEAVRMQGHTLIFRVWGNGSHDPKGFRFACEINLDRGDAACDETVPPSPQR